MKESRARTGAREGARIAALEREVAQLRSRVQLAESMAAIQKKVATLLGRPVVRFERGAKRHAYADLRTQVVAAFERAYVEELLAHTGGNITEAARLGGLDRSNFKRLKRRSERA